MVKSTGDLTTSRSIPRNAGSDPQDQQEQLQPHLQEQGIEHVQPQKDGPIHCEHLNDEVQKQEKIECSDEPKPILAGVIDNVDTGSNQITSAIALPVFREFNTMIYEKLLAHRRSTEAEDNAHKVRML